MKNLVKITLTLVFTVILLTGILMPEILMGTPASPAVGNWYQQFLPNIGGRTISDIFFLDSLTGWAVTPYRFQNDTAYVIKTTNSGDTWFIANSRIGQFVGHNKVKFLNSLTGYVCGVYQTSSFEGLSKSTDGGFNWVSVNVPNMTYNDMAILNEDTIWLAANESLVGGVFRTTNGGALWEQQFSGGNQNPNRIYMYNARIGFMSNSVSPNIYKTTNSGVNWEINLPGENFTDMHFIDSLTGWKCSSLTAGFIRKTTNGGINWSIQDLPPEAPPFLLSRMTRFSFVNADTIWGAGGTYNFGSGIYRGVLYKTTNGGINWGYQIPDTSIHIPLYSFVQFTDKNKGWAYHLSQGGIHTTNGGDTTWLTPVTQISTEIPIKYQLFQNYPNPFNPKTNIKYSIMSNVKGETSNVKLIVYDIQGKEAAILVNEKQSAGTYEVDFSGNGYASGVYFYSLIVNGSVIDTKKMVLIK